MKGMRRRSKLWLAIASTAVLAACNGDLKDTISNVQISDGSQQDANSAPIATAQSVVYGAAGTPIYLKALRSYDPDKDSLSFSWEVVGTPDGGGYSLELDDRPVALLVAEEEGKYTLQVTVSDGRTSSSKEIAVYVDLDGDGIVGGNDFDTDGDGVENSVDAFPTNRAEFADSDQNGTGNFDQIDEDGDGFSDLEDAFPFNPALHEPRITIEEEFNDNPSAATATNNEVPVRLGGIIQQAQDLDFFSFTAQEGKLVTVTCSTDSSDFAPNVAILADTGTALPQTQPDIAGSSLDFAVTVQTPNTGTYFVQIADFEAAGDPSFEYACHAFYDKDGDGIDDSVELANGINPARADSDNDGISDAAEFYVRGAQLGEASDQDSDGVANWLDLDSDGDLILDSIEGAADADGDGYPSFVDTDSDGNQIGDLAEAGIDPSNPADTDLDGQADYADRDDDNDGLSDQIDSNRTQPIKVVSPLDSSNVLRVTGIETTVQGEAMTGLALKGEEFTLSGEGFSKIPSQNVIVVDTGTEVISVEPTSASETTLRGVYPVSADASISVITGNLKSAPIGAKGQSALQPVIITDKTLYLAEGETVEVNGSNLAEPLTVSFAGKQIDASLSFAGDSFTFSVPYISNSSISSGQIIVIGPNGQSNPVDFIVNRSVRVSMSLPAGSSVDESDLKVRAGLGTEYSVPAGGSTRLSLTGNSYQSIKAFIPDSDGGYSDETLSALVAPGETAVTLSALSTAVALVVDTSAIENKLARDSLIDAKTLARALPEVQSLATLISELIVDNPSYLSGSDQDLIDAILGAVEAFEKAAEEAIINGQLQTTQDASTGSQSLIPVEITEEQFDIDVEADLKVGTARPEYNGDVNVLNDTQLALSAQASISESGRVVQNHIAGYFDSKIIPKQNGVYFDGKGRIKGIDFQNAKIEVLTPGLGAGYPGPGDKDVLDNLRTRLLVERAVVPMIEYVIERKFPNSALKPAIDFIGQQGPGLVDTVMRGLSSGQEVATVANLITIIANDAKQNGPFTQALLSAVADSAEDFGALSLADLVGKTEDILTKDKRVKLAVNAKKVANAFLLYDDITQTPSKLEFDVVWPLTVEKVSPAKIVNAPKRVEVVVEGSGFERTRDIATLRRLMPEIIVTDLGENGAGSAKLSDVAEIERGRIIKGYMEPDFVESAVGPIRVEVSNNQLTVSADPFQIEVSDKVEITSIEPNKSAPGEIVVIEGSGFSIDALNNLVSFNGNLQTVSATVVNASPNELEVRVPNGAVTGPVTVGVGQETSNETPFEVVSSSGNVAIEFGDNGAAIDDTYALYVNGSLVHAMTKPARSAGVFLLKLPIGQHNAELRGIDAPDDIGTYQISFLEGVDLNSISGSPLSGGDLVKGAVKRFSFTVLPSGTFSAAGGASKAKSQAEYKILWEE